MLRMKTIPELERIGYALTPAGNLIRPGHDLVAPEKLDYGKGFSQTVLEMIYQSSDGIFVDFHNYNRNHVIHDPDC